MSKLEILSILMDFDISFYFPKIKRIRYKKFVAKQRRSSLRSSLSRNPWKKKNRYFNLHFLQLYRDAHLSLSFSHLRKGSSKRKDSIQSSSLWPLFSLSLFSSSMQTTASYAERNRGLLNSRLFDFNSSKRILHGKG